MKKALLRSLAAAAVAGTTIAMCALWAHRPWRAAAMVNGRTLSVGELSLRGEVLLDDAKRIEKLIVPAGREEEISRHYRREAAKLWIVKEVMLAEAVARGYSVSPEDEKDSLTRFAEQLKKRNLTPERFFTTGRLGEDLKRREYKEGLLIDKFSKGEVLNKISLTDKEIDARLNDLKRISLMTSQPGTKPNMPTRKRAIDSLRGEKYLAGFRTLFRDAFAKAVVKVPAFPDLETLNNVAPAEAKK